MMNTLDNLLQAVEELSEEEIKQLYTYLLTQMTRRKISVDEPRPRVLGLHESQGQAWLSDDFDAPLPDTFWTGEE